MSCLYPYLLFICLFICLEAFSKIKKSLSGSNRPFIQTSDPSFHLGPRPGGKKGQRSVSIFYLLNPTVRHFDATKIMILLQSIPNNIMVSCIIVKIGSVCE